MFVRALPYRSVALLIGAVSLSALIHSATASAQTAAGQAAGDAAIEAGKRIAQDEAERAAGRMFTRDQIELIRTVLGSQAPTGGEDRGKVWKEDDDDEDDDRDGSRDGAKRDDGAKKSASSGRGKGGKKGLPPGLAKRDDLPPGLRKQVERGGSLPPGLAKRDLPDDLNAKLGKPAEGTERAVVDNDVVLIEKATGVVLDVIKDVLGGNQSK